MTLPRPGPRPALPHELRVLERPQVSLPRGHLHFQKSPSQRNNVGLQSRNDPEPRALHCRSAVPVVTNHLLKDKRIIDPVQSQWFHRPG